MLLFYFKYIFNLLEHGSGVEELIDKLAHKTDERGIYCRGDQGAKSDGVEGCVTYRHPIEGGYISEKGKREGQRDRKQRKVEGELGFGQLQLEACGDLGNEQLIYLKRQIRAEEAGNAEGDCHVSDDKHHPA